jgi:pimeloyl-ACP methyl ester carboxylesterase
MLVAVLAACSSSVPGAAVVAPGQPTARTNAPGTLTVPSSPSTSTPRSSTPPASPAAVPAGLEQYYSQQLNWQPCADYARTADQKEAYSSPAVECARLDVPLAYPEAGATVAAGPPVQIGVLRKVATDQNARIGSAVFNPGGPGGSGMDAVAYMVAPPAAVEGQEPDPTAVETQKYVEELNGSFDLVGFDPRGVGASLPTVQCQTNAERDASRAQSVRTRNQADVDAANAAQQKIAELCVQRTGIDQGIDGKEFLANIGTRDVAKDLDVLRAALGDQQLTYVGYSYGTRIGTVYAEQFPENVRALILDGAVDPTEDPAAADVKQGAGFQSAFEDFATWCAEQKVCVLGDDPSKATAVYQSLVRPLLDKPLTLKDGRVLSFDDANTGTAQALYVDAFWPLLSTALLNLSKGDGEILMYIADIYNERDDTGDYGRLLEVFNAVRCVDGPALTDPAAVTQYNADFAAARKFSDSGDPPGARQDICAFWPVPPTMQPHRPDVTGLPQVLVISTTGDPATPYQSGVELAKDLGAALLTVEGTRHTAYLGAGISCVDSIGNDYLIDLTLPPEGTTCP